MDRTWMEGECREIVAEIFKRKTSFGKYLL
jgi:hypothetical protein